MTDPFGCELHTGRITDKGYGRVGLLGAHVVAWVEEYGPVPEGFVVDHLCRRRACRALHHLEAVTQRENLLRRSLAYRLRRKLCAKGHDMQTQRIVIGDTGGVLCRLCNE